MGIFTRFRDIVNSNIGAMLDKAEDPEKMIKMMIREMEDTLIELKSSCAGVIANCKRIERRKDELSEVIQTWTKRAELAVSKGRDDLAREALLEKRRFAEQVESVEEEINALANLIEQYKNDITELENKLTGAREKKRTLVERHKHANGKKRAQEGIRRYNGTDAIDRFDKLESRIDQMEAEADLVNPKTKPTLEEAFAQLATDEQIEKELADLKNSQYSASADSKETPNA
ncbi:Phage shock protein A [Pontiella desulfatans]|uniref:Phage shock protein A n=1 Tax=Pontiella desulfatans TaxID=2750659 RepID=A0A6C2U5V8_PONDE|nr:phage shock protein PspA [Pontiella desulfatans]VGO14786.1 Phage shock protein A [Pontiella desulfatans]